MDRYFFMVSDQVPGCYCSKCGKKVLRDRYNYRKHGEMCGFSEKDFFDAVNSDQFGYRLEKKDDALVFSVCRPELVPIRGFRDKFTGGKWTPVFQAVLGTDTKEEKVIYQKTEVSFDLWIAMTRAGKLVKIHREEDAEVIHSVFPAVVDIYNLQMFVHIYRTKGVVCEPVIPERRAKLFLGREEKLYVNNRSLRVFPSRVRQRRLFENFQYETDKSLAVEWPMSVSLYHLENKKDTYILKIVVKTPTGINGFLISENYVYTHGCVPLRTLFSLTIGCNEEDKKKLELFSERYPQYHLGSFIKKGKNILIPLLADRYHVLLEQAVKSDLVYLTECFENLPEYELDPATYRNLKEAFGLSASFLKKLDWDMFSTPVLSTLRDVRKADPAYVDFDHFTEGMICFYRMTDLAGRGRKSRIHGIRKLNRKQILQIIRYLYKNPDRMDFFYRDYLDMCGQMGNYLDGLTPDNYMLAHDKAEKLYEEKRDIVMQKNFLWCLQEEGYQRLATDYEEKDKKFFGKDEYMIVLPKRSKDLFAESEQMHNCVRTYVEAVSKGYTKIVFLRRKDTPGRSLGTIEVDSENRLLQAKAFANSRLDMDAQKFVRRWADYKNVKIVTNDLKDTAC